MRFHRLREEVEDLCAWPEFQDYALNDPRFLVVGDSIDSSTAGIHTSCAVEEIVIQTVNLLFVPMTDFTLARLVRRLRPDLPETLNPIERAISTGRVFRPRTRHIALKNWLRVHKVPVIDHRFPGYMEDAGEVLIRSSGGPLNTAGLAAAIASHYGISSVSSYNLLADNTALLLLPDGTTALYDQVVEEIEKEKTKGVFDSYSLPDDETHVPLPGEIETISLQKDLIHTVVDRCLSTGRPVSTPEIIVKILEVDPGDRGYVEIYRTVTACLGTSPQLIPVGQNLWYVISQVPSQVFRKIKKQPVDLPSSDETRHDEKDNRKVFYLDEREGIKYINITINDSLLGAGCISDGRLVRIFPEHPMLQVLYLEGDETMVWYNAEHHSIHGFERWFQEKNVHAGDTVTVGLVRGRLKVSIQRGASYTQQVRTRMASSRRDHTGRSLLTTVYDSLIRAGGVLSSEEITFLLNEYDPDITWEEVEPLFHRMPTLRYHQGRCYYIPQHQKKEADDSFLKAGILNIISDLDEEIRCDQAVLNLAVLAVSQPRITVRDEGILIAKAQSGDRGSTEKLTLAHLRHVLRRLLHRSDILELIDDLEDYFQESVIGLINSIKKFDISQGVRLQTYLSWRVNSSVDRAKPRYMTPVRFPNNFFTKIQQYRKTQLERTELPEEGVDEGEAYLSRADYWADVVWEDWNTVCQMIEEERLNFRWLGAMPRNEFCEMIERLYVNDLLKSLNTRQADVIIKYYGIGDTRDLTFREIGDAFGLTRSRIHQIHEGAIRKLKMVHRYR